MSKVIHHFNGRRRTKHRLLFSPKSMLFVNYASSHETIFLSICVVCQVTSKCQKYEDKMLTIASTLKNTALICYEMLVTQLCLTLPHRGLQFSRLLCPRDSPGKNTGMGCHSLILIAILAALQSTLQNINKTTVFQCLKNQKIFPLQLF